MDDSTLAALLGSIRKWEMIAAGTGVDNGVANCSLCLKFYDRFCLKCPVTTKGRKGCSEAPYMTWGDHQRHAHKQRHIPYRVLCPECRRLALDEAAFLRELLPAPASKFWQRWQEIEEEHNA